jgi:STELLO glycosyltransferases
MNKVALVITSIAGTDCNVLQQYARESIDHNVSFIVVGDKKSPDSFSIDNCDYYSIDRQDNLPYRITENLPYNHYARKNIGYLAAISGGAEIIIETDDDNFPFPEFWNERSRSLNVHYMSETGWLNAYKFFTEKNIWPRGFALEHILDSVPQFEAKGITNCPIQQGLADKNPDVDALYRLTQPLPIDFDKNDSIALGNNSICPFNSQNTTWFKEAFMLLYLPSYCSFRMTDIWRSFIAQRIAWSNDWNILFHPSTVWQERNDHDLMRDFSDEIPGYVNNKNIMSALQNLNLVRGKEYLGENLVTCYQKLIEMGLIAPEELGVLEGWIADVHVAIKAQ